MFTLDDLKFSVEQSIANGKYDRYDIIINIDVSNMDASLNEVLLRIGKVMNDISWSICDSIKINEYNNGIELEITYNGFSLDTILSSFNNAQQYIRFKENKIVFDRTIKLTKNRINKFSLFYMNRDNQVCKEID